MVNSAGRSSTLTIALIEDNRFIRDGWRIAIKADAAMNVGGAFSSCEEALIPAALDDIDVVLMDINLPGINGIEGTEQIRRQYPGITIIISTVFEDDENIFKAMAAGASGFILKKASPDELRNTLRNTAAGFAPMSPNVARFVLKYFGSLKSFTKPGSNSLDTLEVRILEQIAAGFSFNAAAENLNMPILEIGKKIAGIYKKLQIE